jgi:hypothetical protein
VHVAVKELVVVLDHVLQILHKLPHHLHVLETFIDRCIEIRDGVMASRTTHRMQPERVIIARVSAVISAVVATTIVVAAVVAAAVGAFGSLLLGTSSQMKRSLSSLSAAAHELGLRSSE